MFFVIMYKNYSSMSLDSLVVRDLKISFFFILYYYY